MERSKFLQWNGSYACHTTLSFREWVEAGKYKKRIKNMNRKQLRAKKSYERHYAAKIAKQCAAFCFDLDESGCYVQITNPVVVETLRRAFQQHLLG